MMQHLQCQALRLAKTKTTKYFARFCKRGFWQESSTLDSSLASQVTGETEVQQIGRGAEGAPELQIHQSILYSNSNSLAFKIHHPIISCIRLLGLRFVFHHPMNLMLLRNILGGNSFLLFTRQLMLQCLHPFSVLSSTWTWHRHHFPLGCFILHSPSDQLRPSHCRALHSFKRLTGVVEEDISQYHHIYILRYTVGTIPQS